MGNHFHFADYMNTLEDGATPFVVLYKPYESGRGELDV